MKIRVILVAAILVASTSLSYAAAGKKQSGTDLVRNAREGVALVGQGLNRHEVKSCTSVPQDPQEP